MAYADVVATVAAVGSLATAVAVVVGFLELKHAQQDATKRFEDELSREYRSIIACLPVDAFFVDGRVELTEPVLRSFYRYFDLSNEQLFHGRYERVRFETLAQWRDGIEGNLALPVFAEAWRLIATRIPKDFLEELRASVPARPAAGSQHG